MQLPNAILIISGISGIVVGTALMTIPKRKPGKPDRFQQWLLECNLLAVLNRCYKIERPLYRHHRIFGMAVVAGALTLLALLFRLQYLLMAVSPWSSMLVVRLSLLAAWGAALFVLIVGVFLHVRPSALKSMEALANRWIEPISLSPKPTISADKWIGRIISQVYSLTGLILLAVGVSCLLVVAG